jgi:hypothetical protein
MTNGPDNSLLATCGGLANTARPGRPGRPAYSRLLIRTALATRSASVASGTRSKAVVVMAPSHASRYREGFWTKTQNVRGEVTRPNVNIPFSIVRSLAVFASRYLGCPKSKLLSPPRHNTDLRFRARSLPSNVGII